MTKYAIDAGHKNLDERTGLPAYPKSTAGTEGQLRNVQQQLRTTLDRTEAALDRVLEEFVRALEVEDRKVSAQSRLDAMTKQRNQRRI